MSAVRPGRLLARWSKRERDILIHFPSAPDGHLLYGALCAARETSYLDFVRGLDRGDSVLAAFHNAQGKTLVQELEARGYDLTTLRFSIDRRPASPGRSEP